MQAGNLSGQEHSKEVVSTLTFTLFIFLNCDYFLHLSSRLPAYSAIRPTLLLVIIITLLLTFQAGKIKSREKSLETSYLNTLILYIVITLPLVEYPGSVIRFHLDGYIKAIVFFYFSLLILDTNKRITTFIWVFISLQVFRALEPLYLHFTIGYWGDETYKGGGEFANRLAGAPADVINANELGFVIVTAIPFLHYLLTSRGLFSKILYLFLVIPMLYALMLTMSRGALLGLIVIGFMIFKESKRKKTFLTITIALVILAWGAMDSFQKDRYLSIFTSTSKQSNATRSGRISGIINEFGLGLERPIIGHGIGTTPEAKSHNGFGLQASHNMYGELLIEIGIIGFILFVRFLFTIRNTLKKLHSQKKNSYTPLTKALTAVFYMYALYSLNYWGLSQYYWYLLAGIVAAVYRVNNIKNTESPQPSEVEVNA